MTPTFRAWLLLDDRPASDAENDTALTVQAWLGAAVEFDDVGAKVDAPADTAGFSDREEVTLLASV